MRGTREFTFVLLRWIGMMGTVIFVASALGALGLGSLYGSAAHPILAASLLFGVASIALWGFASHALRRISH